MRDWVSLREARVRELQAKYPRSGKSKHQLSLCRHDGRLHMTAGRGAFCTSAACCVVPPMKVWIFTNDSVAPRIPYTCCTPQLALPTAASSVSVLHPSCSLTHCQI